MRVPELELICGDVVDVQLTSETVIEQNTPRPEGHIINRMRVFLRGPDGRDPHYDFEECELGVHANQKLAVVRTTPKKHDPLALLLINQTSGAEWEFTDAIHSLIPRPLFGPRWRALGLSVLAFGVGYVLSRFVISPTQSPLWWFWWPALVALLAFPAFWGVMVLAGKAALGAKRQRLRAYIRAQAYERLKMAPAKAP